MLALGMLSLLASCAPPPPPPVAASPPRAVIAPTRPVPAAPADWRDAPATPGTWRWSLTGGKSTASYASAAAAPLVTLTCERSRSLVVLARAAQGADAAAGAVPMELTTTSSAHALMSDPALAAPGWLATAIPARDPLLDAMAFSRGRFALGAAGQATLYLPSWPEVSRVIEDCR